MIFLDAAKSCFEFCFENHPFFQSSMKCNWICSIKKKAEEPLECFVEYSMLFVKNYQTLRFCSSAAVDGHFQ